MPDSTVGVDELAIRSALEEGAGGAKGEIVALERWPYAYRTTFPLEELDVHFSDGSRRAVIVKHLAREALGERERQAKPEFVHDPMREIIVYRDLLSRIGPETTRYYGSIVDPEDRLFVLFVEKVPGIELWQARELETWEEAARWVARLHDDAPVVDSPHLLPYDAAFFRRWPERARRFVGGNLLVHVAARYGNVLETLVASPRSFVHGEFYASNILVARDERRPRVCAIDWEMAGIGPSLLDLAALASGRWRADERARLAAAYVSARRHPVDRESFSAALDCCRLHLALQWLGWSPTWTPPPEHAHDWLAEARDAAERLGL